MWTPMLMAQVTAASARRTRADRYISGPSVTAVSARRTRAETHARCVDSRRRTLVAAELQLPRRASAATSDLNNFGIAVLCVPCTRAPAARMRHAGHATWGGGSAGAGGVRRRRGCGERSASRLALGQGARAGRPSSLERGVRCGLWRADRCVGLGDWVASGVCGRVPARRPPYLYALTLRSHSPRALLKNILRLDSRVGWHDRDARLAGTRSAGTLPHSATPTTLDLYAGQRPDSLTPLSSHALPYR